MNSKDCRHVGTLHVYGFAPQEVYQRGSQLVVRPAFARRRNVLDKAVGFAKACWLWWRVQRLGSRA